MLLKKKLLVASVLLAAQFVHSQEAFSASEGKITGPGGSATFTVGQVFYKSITSSTGSGSVSPGVQQPFEIQVLSSPELTTVKVTAATYPNPTKDFIVLEITDAALKNLQYTLFDINGSTIASHVIAASSTQIQLQHLSIGVYVLKVSQQNKPLKTFKIIKN